jgi:hypothetical protein
VRILFVGDIVGRSGRAILLAELPRLRTSLALDAVIVNAENAAGGYGLTAAIAGELFGAGADMLTMGNHVWDQRELIGHIDREPRIVRPLNLAPGTPGRGMAEIRSARGQWVLVLQVLGRLFMALADDPFRALDAELSRHTLGGRVSLVAGTHTHVPTADARILAGGTAYITDLGMTGDYDSVIGMDKTGSLQKWRSDLPVQRLTPAMGEAMLCGVYVETDDRSGLALRVEPIRLGHGLSACSPETLS